MAGCYKVKPVKDGYVIERPDGSHVDNHVWKHKRHAEKRLEIMDALGYTKC